MADQFPHGNPSKNGTKWHVGAGADSTAKHGTPSVADISITMNLVPCAGPVIGTMMPSKHVTA